MQCSVPVGRLHNTPSAAASSSLLAKRRCVFSGGGAATAAAAAATAQNTVVSRSVCCHALPKRRKLFRKKAKKSQEEPKQFSDEELIRELNSSHLWLPDVDANTDFGLDDVAAHVASRNQAQVVDLNTSSSSSSSNSSKKGSSSSSAAADPQTLSDIDPTSGQPLPEWIADLRAAGFDVMSRDGQLYLQRGNVVTTATPTSSPQHRQQQQVQPQQRPPPSAARLKQQQQLGQAGSLPAAGAAGAGAAQQPDPTSVLQVSDKSLSVGAEFDAAVWQVHIHNAQAQGGSSSRGSSSEADVDAAAAAAAAAGTAWYATTSSPADSTTTDTSSSSSPSTSTSTSSTQDTDSENDNNTPLTQKPPTMSAAAIQRFLLSQRHPQHLLTLLQRVFPDWVANGAWLVSQSGVGVVTVGHHPSPAEAAAALKGLALAARRARYNSVQLQSLAREPLVTGLVEALRLTPPRCPPHQPPDLTRRLWSIAKAYWMQPGAVTAAAAQQALLAGALAGQGRHGQQMLGLAGARGGSALGPLLAQLQARGGAVSKQQLAAAQALVSVKGEDQLRRTAVVSALWGLSCIGGALFFQQDMDALCQIAQAKFSRWSPSPSELSDVLWALAHARHWSPLLTQLESCLLTATPPTTAGGRGGSISSSSSSSSGSSTRSVGVGGGVCGLQACSAAELVTCLWAFAVLGGHVPTQLLEQLNTHGWVVRPDTNSSSGSGSGRSSDRQQAGSSSRSSSRGGKSKTSAAQQAGAAASSRSEDGPQALSLLRDSQLCTLAWSLACLQQVDGGLFKAVWAEVCRRGPQLCVDTRQAVQLAQSALAIQLEGSYRPDELLPGPGTEQLLSAAASVFAQQGAALQAQKAHSSYQRSIAGTLSRLRVMHVMEDNSTGYAVDITVPSLRLAIEADGPSHFSRTPGPPSTTSGSSSSSNTKPPSGRLLQVGATAMKRRHLSLLGWTVVNIPYSEWDRQSDEQQRVAYLKQRIAAARKAADGGGAGGAGGATAK